MKIDPFPRFPDDSRQLVRKLTDLFRDIAQQLNMLTEGRVAASYAAATAAPTSGTYAQGDFVRNSAPVETGMIGVRYVVIGWICTAGGTPGTFLQCRVFTGN